MRYEKLYELELNRMVDVAEMKGPTTELCIIRRISRDDSDSKIQLLDQLREQKFFVACHEIFVSEAHVHLVCEFLDLTLLHILGAPVFPTERQIAAIAGQARRPQTQHYEADQVQQILAGLQFLEKRGLVHSNLTLSTVVLNQTGHVKICM